MNAADKKYRADFMARGIREGSRVSVEGFGAGRLTAIGGNCAYIAFDVDNGDERIILFDRIQPEVPSGPCVRDMANPAYVAAIEDLIRIRADVPRIGARAFVDAIANVAAIFQTTREVVTDDLYAVIDSRSLWKMAHDVSLACDAAARREVLR